MLLEKQFQLNKKFEYHIHEKSNPREGSLL